MTGAPGSPWLWSLPFLLTFLGGVFADAYESPHGRLALGAAGAIVLLQAVLCILSLPGFDLVLLVADHIAMWNRGFTGCGKSHLASRQTQCKNRPRRPRGEHRRQKR